MIVEHPLVPTVAAIDEWLARTKKDTDGSYRYWIDGPHYGVNIWTKASQARCVTSKVLGQDGKTWYWTIKGEGSSNGCREYAIPEDKIVRAVGCIVGDENEIPAEYLGSVAALVA